jgi:hypothetical protein
MGGLRAIGFQSPFGKPRQRIHETMEEVEDEVEVSFVTEGSVGQFFLLSYPLWCP